VWSSSSIFSKRSYADGSFIFVQRVSHPILSFYISSGIKQPYPYLNAISFIALDPNKHVKGIKFEIVKFLIFDELFKENTGCLPAQKDRKITPQAQISTDVDYV
jgi:hypothetical protein